MTTNNGDERPDLLARLSKLNPTLVVLGTVFLFLGALLLPDLLGGVLVLVIAAALGWLLTKTWPVLVPTTRVLRLIVIGLLLIVALLKITSV